MNAARVSQWLDTAVIGNHIAELNDFRNAAEVFDKARRAAERLAREVVNGNLAVVEIGVRNAAQILVNEILDNAEVLTNGGRADLFVVADDENRFAEIQRDQGHHIALARFVNDDNVEASHARIEVFHNARKRHDPHGDGAAALAHFSGGFRAKEGYADAVAL